MESKKITVKHYLNKRAKPRIYEDEPYYPLYVQLIVHSRKAQLKSRINHHLNLYPSEIELICKKDRGLAKLMRDGYFNEKQIAEICRNDVFPLNHLLNDEIEVIRRIITLQRPFENKDFTLNSFAREYQLHITEITEILDNCIKHEYRENLNRIFHTTVDNRAEKKAFNIANYFIHYLNWEYTFCNFYEMTYEVIPSELKYIENYLEKSLLTAIKAYLAFHSKVNLLKRNLEKQKHGKISSLSYLDWITEVKGYIMKEFTKIFGKKKAVEYVDSLDSILVGAIKD